MFHRESDMAPSVKRWMERAGLHVKREFITPWGICDLVGLSFNSANVAHRLSLRQRKSVGSITRAALLLEVPDVEDRKSISMNRLAKKFATSIGPERVAIEAERLIADGFLVRTPRGHLQKLNGWMPLQNRLVAVELKLSRIEEAMQQARANLGFAEESYVAFPMPIARRIARDPSLWSTHFEAGIGLIGVLQHRCDVLVPHSPSTSISCDPAIRLYCVEKFWRTHRAV